MKKTYNNKIVQLCTLGNDGMAIVNVKKFKFIYLPQNLLLSLEP
jgi:hypothetical protein